MSGAIYEMVERRLLHEIIQDQDSVRVVTLCHRPGPQHSPLGPGKQGKRDPCLNKEEKSS